MTGYESKRAAARDKLLDDDDTQVYQQAAAFIAAAFIAAEERKVGTRYGYVPKLHPSEYMDEQPAQEPVCPACKAGVLYECVACSSNNYPAQPAQEPVAYYHPHKGFYWAKPTHISAPIAVDVPPVSLYVKWRAAQRTWVGLTDADWKEIEDMPDTFDQGVAWAQAKLKERNA